MNEAGWKRRTTALAVGGLAFSTVVLVVGPASAYYGPATTVQSAVLTSTKVVQLLGWDNTTNPIVDDGVVASNIGGWDRSFTVTSHSDTVVEPWSVGLTASKNTAARDALFTQQLGELSALGITTNSQIVSQTSTSITLDLWFNGLSDPAPYGSLTEIKAGSDGLAFAWCQVPGTSTTTPAQRAGCSQSIANAQAAVWAKMSPALVFSSSSTVSKRLLTAFGARTAVKVPQPVALKVVSTRGSTVAQDGRSLKRTYAASASPTTLKRLRFIAPSSLSVTQYGNRLNSSVAFAALRRFDVAHHHVFGTSPTRYSYVVTATAFGGSTSRTITVVAYSDAVVTSAVDANPWLRPTSTACLTASRTLAASQIATLRSLLDGVK